jgi:hypothetical protein
MSRSAPRRKKTPSSYPLELQLLYDLDGGPSLGYYSKGHHGRDAFLAVVERELDEGLDPWMPGYVLQQYWRTIPVHDGSGVRFQAAPAGARGAFPVTLLDVDQYRRDQATPRILAKHRSALAGHGARCSCTPAAPCVEVFRLEVAITQQERDAVAASVRDLTGRIRSGAVPLPEALDQLHRQAPRVAATLLGEAGLPGREQLSVDDLRPFLESSQGELRLAAIAALAWVRPGAEQDEPQAAPSLEAEALRGERSAEQGAGTSEPGAPGVGAVQAGTQSVGTVQLEAQSAGRNRAARRLP